MNKTKEEFEKFTYPATKCGCGEMHFPYRFKNDCSPNEVWNWINQNYISKEQVLNLECLKEEEPDEFDDFIGTDRIETKNKLRKEIKEEIKKL